MAQVTTKAKAILGADVVAEITAWIAKLRGLPCCFVAGTPVETIDGPPKNFQVASGDNLSSAMNPNIFTSPGWLSGTGFDFFGGTGVATVTIGPDNSNQTPGFVSNEPFFGEIVATWKAPYVFAAGSRLIPMVDGGSKPVQSSLVYNGTDEAGNVATGVLGTVKWAPIILKPGDNHKIAIQAGDEILLGCDPYLTDWVKESDSTAHVSASSCQDTKLLQATLTAAPGADGGGGTVVHNGDTEHDVIRMRFAAAGHNQEMDFNLADKDGNALMAAGTTQTGKDFWASVDVFSVSLTNVADGSHQVTALVDTSNTQNVSNTNLAQLLVGQVSNGGGTVSGNVTVTVYAPGMANGFGNAVLWANPDAQGNLTAFPNGFSVSAASIPATGLTVYLQSTSASVGGASDVAVVAEYDPGAGYVYKKVCRDVVAVGTSPVKMDLDVVEENTNLPVVTNRGIGGAGANEAKQGYVPVNNDNDDYAFDPDGNQVLDLNKMTTTIGEHDLVPLHIHKVNPVAAGGKFKIVFTSQNIRVWATPDKSKNSNGIDRVTSDTTEFDATADTMLYIEGLQESANKNDEVISLKWTNGATTVNKGDLVKLTVYLVTGPLNVPGFTIYTYKADVPGGQVGSWRCAGGTIISGQDTNSCSILWNNEPIVGKAVFKVADGFECTRLVNVVQVQLALDLATNHIEFTKDPAIQIPTASGSPSLTISSDPLLTNSAMSCRIGVQKLSGPVVVPIANAVMRGVRFVQVGFIQNLTVTQQHADYATGNVRVSNTSETLTLLDYVEQRGDSFAVPSTIPWAYRNGRQDRPNWLTFVQQTKDAPLANLNFNFGDGPGSKATYTFVLNGADASRFSIKWDFVTYLAVSTSEASGYTQRAKFRWHFNGSGPVTQKQWQLDPDLDGVSIDGDDAFTEISDGSRIPVVKGPAANTVLNLNPKWAVTPIQK